MHLTGELPLPDVCDGLYYDEVHPLRNHIVRKPLDKERLYDMGDIGQS